MTVPNWHVNWRQLECLQATFEPSPLEIYNEKIVSSVDTVSEIYFHRDMILGDMMCLQDNTDYGQISF